MAKLERAEGPVSAFLVHLAPSHSHVSEPRNNTTRPCATSYAMAPGPGVGPVLDTICQVGVPQRPIDEAKRSISPQAAEHSTVKETTLIIHLKRRTPQWHHLE